MVVVWIGDIDKSKIFNDPDYLMRVIEKTDLNCRQERYRPLLHRISEQIEEDEPNNSVEDGTNS